MINTCLLVELEVFLRKYTAVVQTKDQGLTAENSRDQKKKKKKTKKQKTNLYSIKAQWSQTQMTVTIAEQANVTIHSPTPSCPYPTLGFGRSLTQEDYIAWWHKTSW